MYIGIAQNSSFGTVSLFGHAYSRIRVPFSNLDSAKLGKGTLILEYEWLIQRVLSG